MILIPLKRLKWYRNDVVDSALSQRKTYKWVIRFKDGWSDVEDDLHDARPSTSKADQNVGKIREMLTENRKVPIWEKEEETKISFESVRSILYDDLGLVSV